MAVKDLVDRYEARRSRNHPASNTSPRSVEMHPLLHPSQAVSRTSTRDTDSMTLHDLTNATTSHESRKLLTKSYDLEKMTSNDTLVVPSLMQEKGMDEPVPVSAMVPLPASKSAKNISGTTAITNSHNPVPAATVFARSAAPLFLPDLDDYLSKLPPPQFSPSTNREKEAQPGFGMFPPMDRLYASKRSLQDLETNTVVAPPWRNKNSIFGSLVNMSLGITGSSVVATFYSLQGVLDTVQIFALLLSTIIPHSSIQLKSEWEQVLLGMVPNVLALNFGSTLVESMVFLGLFMAIACLLLYYFWVATDRCEPQDANEGFASFAAPRSTWGVIIVTFILSVLYLPLSTIAAHALVWSDDFWVVPNPYINATTNPPVLPPLGPANEFRDPLDFCYTTTMKRNEVNLAPIIIIASAMIFFFMTIWFPLRLRRVISQAIPVVDKYTELGKLRSASDMDREYQRLLSRDRQPLTFLYDDYRRGWGTYKAFFLFMKFSALVIITIINPDNCLFRSLTRFYVSVTREAVLVGVMLAFFLLQCFRAPFMNPVNNASEWISRLNYVLTALVGLGVAADMPGQDILNGPVLYIIYIVTYGLSAYFTIIDFSWMHRVVKRITTRVDFSIDIFSPRLDLSSSSPHVKRRIWQESISTLFLTSPECKIPADQKMNYAQASDAEFPPYLLDFKGTPAERHVENLKILREVGLPAYTRGLAVLSEGDCESFRILSDRIQKHHVGPDSYYKEYEGGGAASNYKVSYFGNAWWIPFPPSLVLRYDDGSQVVLTRSEDLRRYITQNESCDVMRKRQIRLALRALDGQIVHWPYNHKQPIGHHVGLCCNGRKYQAGAIHKFIAGVFNIRHKGNLSWANLQLGSGFDIELVYSKDVTLNGDGLGLEDDWELTPSIAAFLSMNRKIIAKRLHLVEFIIQDYREHHYREARAKAEVLSYRFLTAIYNKPQQPSQLGEQLTHEERDLRVRQLIVSNEAACRAAFERIMCVSASEVATWWYIFWDDVWRRNYDTILSLQKYPADFDPHYPTSIAYKPVSRATLEAFLTQRGLYSAKLKVTGFFHSGLLNKIYFRLNGIAFRDASHAIVFHLGQGVSELDLDDIDLSTHARSSSLGTGGGTDHDDSSIRPRPNYRWEGILGDPLITEQQRHKEGWLAMFGVWFGLTPLWRTGVVSQGLALDVKLDNGKYVLLNTVTE